MSASGASAQSNNVPIKQGLTTAQREALVWTNTRIQACRQTAWHWDDLMGRHRLHFGYQPGSTTSLAYAGWALKTCKARSHKLHLQAKHWMSKRTKVHLIHIGQLQMALGMDKPMRILAEAEGIESRFNQSGYLDKKLTKQWQNSSLFKALSCIHRYEGAWNSVSHTKTKYYGGLQQDSMFMQQYGPEFLAKWGTANHWPVWAQMVAASRAVRGWVGPDPRTRAARGYHPWPNTAHDCGLI